MLQKRIAKLIMFLRKFDFDRSNMLHKFSSTLFCIILIYFRAISFPIACNDLKTLTGFFFNNRYCYPNDKTEKRHFDVGYTT